MSRVKSAGEERRGRKREQGRYRDTRWIEQLEHTRAAGSWQQQFEMRSPTNPLLWQMPDVSQPFTLWSAGALKKVIFLLKGAQDVERPWTRGSHWYRTIRAWLSPQPGELCRAAEAATWTPDSSRLLREVFEEAFKSLPTPSVRRTLISSADGVFNPSLLDI